MSKISIRFKKLSVLLAAIAIGILLVGIGQNAEAAGGASISSCVINPYTKDVVSVSVQADAGIAQDDGKLYLFAVPTYVDSVAGQTPIAQIPYNGAGKHDFVVALRDKTEHSLLYSKFYVAVKSGGNYVALTNGNFITNPEAIAPSNVAREETSSKKGVQIDFYIPTDLEDLGANHAFFNMHLEDVISNDPTWGTPYTYNGKTYYVYLDNYDTLISNMTKAGMSVNVALLYSYKYGYEYLLYPGVSPNDATTNYAVSTSTQQSLEQVAAVTHFLAERYNGLNPAYGKVENWIIGNEVNDNLQYNYMGPQDVDTFVREYLQSFRVMYNAIKSGYGNANVYVCLQHRWKTTDGTLDYSGKSFVEKFNAYAKAQGDIDWGLAYHPYSFPLNDADILNDGEQTKDHLGNDTYGGEVTDSIDTAVVTMKNLHHLTEYFHRSEMLNASGEVRSIILSEQGYTSYSNITGQNEAKQAANIALAYYIAEMNKDIDAFILRGHSDANEGSPYYKFGIWNVNPADGKPVTAKYVYDMYKHIDTEDSLEYTEFAKTALNINEWSDVVKYWDANAFNGMGTRTDAPLYTVQSASGTKSVVATMLNQWEPGYNVYSIGEYDYAPSYRPEGVAVANPYAYYLAYQGVEKKFAAPVDLSSNPYLTLDIKFSTKDASTAGDRLELKVRVHSGEDVFDATGIISVNKDYKVCLDLSQWRGKNAIDGIEVLNREYGKQTASFDGTFTVYNVAGASNVTGKSALTGVAAQKIDLSSAQLAYQGALDYSGKPVTPEVTVKLNGQILNRYVDYDVIYHDNVQSGTAKLVVVGIGNYTGYTSATFTIKGGYPTVYKGVDYSLVFAYGYYKEKYPEIVAVVGDDPNVLLAHFVEKGMQYGLQGIGSFNVFAYGKINDDMEVKYGNDLKAWYMHYIVYGLEENRSISGTMPSDVVPPTYPGDDPSENWGDGGNGGGTVVGPLGFIDVAEGAYYYDAVAWAVENNITKGYGRDDVFNPDGICNRGQIVTFLWRANGSPEPTNQNNPFTDVSSDQYYYEAVLWAVENGITAGYGSDTIFNPDGECTRGQVATFLWRAKGQPVMANASNPFGDVASGAYYYDAVLWAVENGITNGYGGNDTFAPDINCTRGQIVTFLYRAMK